jgi:16S rRNA (uracil1498-N3)-methyltransferase
VRRRFFVKRFTGGMATLEGSAAHHLARVLRAAPGQEYELSDGERVYLGRIEQVGRESVEFRLLEQVRARPVRLEPSLLISIVKFDRFEWALEKATELGVSAVVPLAAARSEQALLQAAPKRAARWEKILTESAQQARCLRAPVLRPPARPADAFRAEQSPIRVLLSEERAGEKLRKVLDAQIPASEAPVRIALAIGPEGGWTEEEVAAARAAHFVAASLGENILRTETAVVAGLAAAHLYLD